jgi:PAS domain S-box-containing protein
MTYKYREKWEAGNLYPEKDKSSPAYESLNPTSSEPPDTRSLDTADPDLIRRVLQENEEWYHRLFELSPVGVSWIDTRTGRFLGVNRKLCEITGRTEEDLLRQTFQNITHPDDLPFNMERWRDLTEARVRAFVWQKRLVRPDGSVRRVEVTAVPMGQSERPLRSLGIVQDVTDSHHAQQRLREYERVIEGLREMITVVDREYRFVIANRAYLDWRSLTSEQVIGHAVSEVMNKSAWPLVKQKLDECFQGKVVHYQMKYAYADRGERDLSISYFPIEGPAGVDRIASVLEDITEQKRAEKALLESEARMRLAHEVAQIGTFERSLVTEEASWSSEMEAIYGLGAACFPRTIDAFLHLIHPEDQARVADLTARSKESGIGQGEWRVIWPDGSVHWISSRWKVLKDPAGKPDRLIGAAYDITDRKRIEEDLRLAKEKLAEEKHYLEESIDAELGFGEIVGRSSMLKGVMEKLARVAPSDATVLLLGETGTGKELAARAVHRMSRRQAKSFIKVNCAAIPSGLLESELFGHEKGAFTGALNRKVGRLELADGGTLFLDEIGEVPLSLQPKLLRALQEMEFERLGSTQTLKVNFRLVAATNRDLLQSMKASQFRSDLYYRLNVFPVVLPPLRERREDIPVLIEHFVRMFAQKMNKSIASIPTKTMEELMRWEWPGNVRELENFVERSVILTPGSVLQSPLSELPAAAESTEVLQDVDRDRILQILRECHGQLGGPHGAASRLGLKRTTLQSKLDQMGIKPGTFRS